MQLKNHLFVFAGKCSSKKELHKIFIVQIMYRFKARLKGYKIMYNFIIIFKSLKSYKQDTKHFLTL